MFLNDHVHTSSHDMIPWYVDFSNFLVSDILLEVLSSNQKKKFLHDVFKFYWDKPYLFRVCVDNVICRCIPIEEMLPIMEASHSCSVGGHHSGIRTTRKIL